MKLTIKKWLIAVLSAVFLAAAIWAVTPVIAASADEGDITCETASGNYLNEDYLAVYKIPADMITYEANGGESGNNTIANAFDGNWNSFWQTATENKGQGSDNPEFLNAITVTFSKAVSIDSIVYASSSARLGHGYPIVLNVYTANGGELSLYGTCNSAATDNRVVFRLKETVTVTQVKFEFRKVNTMHNWTATAKEIQFLQPDNASANKVLDLFEDYAQLTVKNEYKTSLSELRSGVSSLISYESALKPLLDRAEKIVSGQLKKDSRREFSTDKNAENVIAQYGNLRSYAGNTLKMSSFGINRQVLGVGGLKGDKIIIYVEADAGDPLPSIAFTQVYGDWRSWQSTYNLSLGKNVLTFPNFITDNYSKQVVAGGPIHLINAYEPSQQSSKVKIYVEGGYLYPVFRKGGDVNSFLTELTSYCDKINEEGLNDVAELVGDHFLHTVSAKNAYNDFVTRKVNPQKNAESWDNYISALLEFGGVSLTPEGEHYNEKNDHLYTNFRMVQPWAGAGAFAAGDHIGFISFGEGAMTSFGTLGWGIAHEIGHALDVNGRTIGETTNNMWSKFALAYFQHDVSRNFNTAMTNTLAPDETALSANLFDQNRYNYQLWWNLEACYHGFWGKLDNMYRYYDEAAARNKAGVTADDGQLSTTERMVYFSSLVVGEDLGYYYERFGFSFTSGDNYTPFRVETASAAYKKLVAKALEDKEIIERGFKYWYIDADQYFYEFSGNACYPPSSSVSIRGVWKTSSGYMLILDEPSDNSPHLGYEIMEYRKGKWSVIGFTYSGSYTDTTAYENGYIPQYKIRAYDREMSVSAESTASAYIEISQTRVCRIGEVYYNSIAEAVAAASANDTIYICAHSREEAITVNKNLTLLPEPSLKDFVIITRSAMGAMFTVESGVTLTIGDNNGASIILDGNSFTQNGALIRVNGGTLRVYNAELRNNRNTDHGGAVFNTGNSAFTNVTIKNNFTSINGGAIANFSGGIVTLADCTISGNSAKGNGGALTIDGKTILTRVNVTGNTASNVGGAMYMLCGNDARFVSIEGGKMGGNTAGKNGSAIYLDKGTLTLIGGDTEMKLTGEIYKNSGSINISTALPDLSDVTFRTPSVTEGTQLLKANGSLTFTQTFAEGLKVELSDAYLGDDDTKILLKPWPTVTFNVNGTGVKQQVALGSLVLPNTVQGLDESKYITQWEFNGIMYATGSTVEISGDCSLTAATLGNKFTVTLNYGENKTATHYVMPDESLVLEECSAPQGKAFSHWDVNGVSYRAGDSVRITGDTVMAAVFKELEDGADDGNGGSQTTPPDDGGKPKTWVVILIIAVVFLVIVGLVAALIFVIKRERARGGYEEDGEEGDEE